MVETLRRVRSSPRALNRRVVMFAPSLAEPGGANRRARLLAEGLYGRGWEVLVVARAGTARRLAAQRRPGFLVVEVPGFSSRALGAALYSLLAVPLGLYWGARGAAYLSIQLSATSSVGGLCATICRRRFLAATSTSGRLAEANLLRARGVGRVRRFLLERSTLLLVQTEEACRELAPVVPKCRLAVLPNPVECPGFAPLNGDPNVLYTGRLAEEKNLLRLLDAWKVVLAKLPNARLTLAGRGGGYRSIEDVLRSTVEADPVLRATVTFAGWVTDVQAILRRHDVFVLPSLSEGMSNSLLEAASVGRVVVASDIPANRAVLGEDYPLLFPAEDTNSLGTALLAALCDDAMQRASVEALAKHVDEFRLDRILDRLEGWLLGVHSP